MKKLLTTLILMNLLSTQVFAASWQIQQAREEYNAGQYDNALKSINSAMVDNSSFDKESIKLRMSIYIKLHNPDKALEDFTKLGQDTTYASIDNIIDLANELGWEFYRSGNFEKAGDMFLWLGQQALYLRTYKQCEWVIEWTLTSMNGLKEIINSEASPEIKYGASLYWCKMLTTLLENDYIAHRLILLKPYEYWFYRRLIIASLAGKYCLDNTKKDSGDSVINIVSPLLNNDKYGKEFAKGVVTYYKDDKELGRKIMLGVLKEQAYQTGQNEYKYAVANFEDIIKSLDTGKICINTQNNTTQKPQTTNVKKRGKIQIKSK